MRECERNGGRLLLGDNTDGGAVMLRPIRFRCVGSSDFNWTALHVHIQLTLYIYIYIYIYTELKLGAGIFGA